MYLFCISLSQRQHWFVLMNYLDIALYIPYISISTLSYHIFHLIDFFYLSLSTMMMHLYDRYLINIFPWNISLLSSNKWHLDDTHLIHTLIILLYLYQIKSKSNQSLASLLMRFNPVYYQSDIYWSSIYLLLFHSLVPFFKLNIWFYVAIYEFEIQFSMK